MTLPPPPYPPPPYSARQYPASQTSAARIVWIVVGALILFFGVGLLGFPGIVWAFGAPIDLGRAVLFGGVADLVFAGVYVAGILVARRRPDGRLRAIPPAVAAGVLFGGFIVAGNLIFTVAAR